MFREAFEKFGDRKIDPFVERIGFLDCGWMQAFALLPVLFFFILLIAIPYACWSAAFRCDVLIAEQAAKALTARREE